jgi:predicted Zn-dependent peptidase
MEKVYYAHLNETVYQHTLANGLQVYMIPKNDFHKLFATFTTHYGSFDQSFISPKTGKKVNQPEGIAHFLEHKMFSMPDKTDAFETLSKFGVNANAYTNFDRTSYLFSGTKNIEAALNYLLDFVQTPYFTVKSVKKEQGIIAEELRMYADYPNQRLFYGLLQNLYQKHPIHVEIGGTVESIHKITAKKLYDAYETFYHPSNMEVVLVGHFDPEVMVQLIEDNQSKKGYVKQAPIKRFMPKEPKNIRVSHDEIEMPVVMPKLALGVKLTPASGKEALKKDIALAILMDMYFSNSTKNYQQLLQSRLINESFEYTSIEEENAFTMAFFGDTVDPSLLKTRLTKMILALKRQKHDPVVFERHKKSTLGSFVMSLNSLESISMGFTNYLANGVTMFEVPEIIESIDLNDIQAIAKDIQPKRISSFVVMPVKAQKATV